ncbi:hypothetical protein DSO57_1020734 [Entomophthora muscae]|uniref:Uncharacterized protein n=1 Tax=Entomophthora muscae TaxID=34485 RepID=A0ACC2UQ23_9FUNG|nr:hypothetical protein DSO57_1020734 [Entomophthora muscae]
MHSISESEKSSLPRLKMAVIGSGLSGLTLANLAGLSEKYEVTIFEKESKIGMEAHSVVADIGIEGVTKEVRFDVPLRGVLYSFYPHLVRMYRYFDIGLVKSENNFSFSWTDPELVNVEPFFSSLKYNFIRCFDLKLIALPLCPSAFSEVLGWLADIFQRGMLSLEWLRLLTTAVYLRRSGGFVDLDEPLGKYLERNKYSVEFSDGMVVPLFSVFCTCSFAAVRQYPARVILDMLSGIATGNSLTAQGGVGTLCAKLVSAVGSVRLNSPVVKVLPLVTPKLKDIHLSGDADRSLPWTLIEDDSGKHLFNHVIFATQANQACQQLDNSTQDMALEQLKQVLGAFSYEVNTVATHFDESLLPLSRQNWRANNIFVPKGANGIAMDTIHLNTQCSIPTNTPVRDVFQTYNPFKKPSSDLLISHASLQRVLVTSSSSLALDKLDLLQGTYGLYFVGSYTYPGLPLLEGCVANSERLARSLGIPIPWEKPNALAPVDLPIPKHIVTSLNEAYFSLSSLIRAPENTVADKIYTALFRSISYTLRPSSLTLLAFFLSSLFLSSLLY